MAVETGINPMNNEPFTIVAGVVKKITFFEAKNNQFATHTASILVDDVYVKMNLKVNGEYAPRIQYVVGKKPNDKWETLKEGDTVRIAISKESEWNGKKQYQTTSSRIIVTEKGNGSVVPAKNAPSDKPATSGAAGNKIYGEVKTKDKGIASLFDENLGKEFIVDLTDHPEVEVGHKMGAFISATGQIINGFKHYPPKVSNGKKADAFGSPERQFKMSFGNMVNVAAIAMPKASENEIFEMAQQLFVPAKELREKLLKEFEGVRDEGDVGGKLGDALKHSAEHNGKNIPNLIQGAESWFRAHIEAENEMRDILEGKSSNSEANQSEDDNDIPVDDDYDDSDIPF